MTRYDLQSVCDELTKKISHYRATHRPRGQRQGTKTECLLRVAPDLHQMATDGFSAEEMLEAIANDQFKVGPKLLTEVMKQAADRGRTGGGARLAAAKKKAAPTAETEGHRAETDRVSGPSSQVVGATPAAEMSGKTEVPDVPRSDKATMTVTPSPTLSEGDDARSEKLANSDRQPSANGEFELGGDRVGS